MHKILLVEDSKEVHAMVKVAIGSVGNLEWCQTLTEARKKNFDDYSLLLLDLDLPDGSGLELCTELQNDWPLLPIFILTSSSELSEKVLGFSAGADDYITKPFANLELKARVEARLRTIDLMEVHGDILEWLEIKIDKARQEVVISNDDGESLAIQLTALEFKLLTYFAEKAGEVVPREQILDDIWGKNVHIYPRSVDTHVSKLRKKLEHRSSLIESVHGAGYKFNPS